MRCAARLLRLGWYSVKSSWSLSSSVLGLSLGFFRFELSSAAVSVDDPSEVISLLMASWSKTCIDNHPSEPASQHYQNTKGICPSSRPSHPLNLQR